MSDTAYYDLLGVARTATADEIKAAYRKRAREVHPDVNKDPDAPARFKELQEAYEVLSDPDKRKQYDTFGRAGVAGGVGSGSGEGPGFRYAWSGGSPGVEFDEDDLGSVFDAFFGGGGKGPGRAQRARPRPRRGADSRIDLTVDLAEIAGGTTRSIRVRSDDKAQTIDVTIPAGIAEGKTLRVAGEGQPSATGGPRGDLLVTIRVRPHPLFRRGKPGQPDESSLDLFFELPLTVPEAVRGAKVDIPTLEGRVGLTVPPGTGSGKVLRLRRRGLGGPGGAKGDLYAQTAIAVPRAEDLPEAVAEQLDAMLPKDGNPRAGPAWN
jgi:curved DNA-binding protein